MTERIEITIGTLAVDDPKLDPRRLAAALAPHLQGEQLAKAVAAAIAEQGAK